MKKNDILISVVMGVYNGETYLKSAIQSVLDQSYENFEFIIVDDASTDNTAAILAEFQDKRIKVLKNDTNKRLAYSLNRAISAARGKYILRMDADDLCMPERFEKQVSYMEKHPEIGISFGNIACFSDGKVLNILDTNEGDPEYIRANMIFFSTVCHPSVIMRREIFDMAQYNEKYTVSEDLELWLKVLNKYSIKKTKDNTLLYRVHQKQVSSVYSEKQIAQEMEMKIPYLRALLGDISEEECKIHSRISRRSKDVLLDELTMWLKKMREANKKKQIYDIEVFEQVLLRIGIIVAVYNQYLPKFMSIAMREFGLAALFRICLRMIKNVIVMSWNFIRNLSLMKAVVKQYQM